MQCSRDRARRVVFEAPLKCGHSQAPTALIRGPCGASAPVCAESGRRAVSVLVRIRYPRERPMQGT